VNWKPILVRALVPALGLPLLAAAPPVMFETPLSPRNANYEIRATLDPARHNATAEARIRWRNLTQDAVSDAWFHLYLNAFANDRSLFMRESEGSHRQFGFDFESWGYCRVTRIAQVRPDGSKTPLKPVYPGPGEDRTVMRVVLAEPVPPGGETLFEVSFEDRFPKIFARAGFAGSFHMAGQWFPKLGVYQEGRGWNCHPYHLNSEFFSDFGVYDVTLTLPKEFVVGATGVLWSEAGDGNKKTLSFHAEDVHDFAWAASPDFLDETREFGGVKVRVLMQPGNRASMPRYFSAMERALKSFERMLMRFPYPQVTVVDPPLRGEGAGGMEYPMLITGIASPFIPASVLLPELVVVHEFGHNYWYGICANNEFEEAWLDEGINSYYEWRIMDEWYGERTSIVDGFLGIRCGDREIQRSQYIGAPDLWPTVQPSWKYPGFGSYGAMTYNKPALMLKTLEGVLGREKMDEVMRAFFLEVKFTHPTTEDFLRITSEAAGRDLRPLLEPVLYGTGTVDFRVARVKSASAGKPKGLDLDQDPPRAYSGPERKAGKGEKEKRSYASTVIVQRRGELVVPVEILVTFEDGTSKRETWDGGGRSRAFTFEGARVRSVVLDPEGKVPLDLSRLNNGWVRQGDPAPARSATGRLRALLQTAMVLLAQGL
jgi:hypothetical protein